MRTANMLGGSSIDCERWLLCDAESYTGWPIGRVGEGGLREWRNGGRLLGMSRVLLKGILNLVGRVSNFEGGNLGVYAY